MRITVYFAVLIEILINVLGENAMIQWNNLCILIKYITNCFHVLEAIETNRE